LFCQRVGGKSVVSMKNDVTCFLVLILVRAKYGQNPAFAKAG
jgi:hypothetical protein